MLPALIDHEDVNKLIMPGTSEIVGVQLSIPPGVRSNQDALTQYGLKVTSGRALVHSFGVLPIIDGMTCTRAFYEYNPSKIGDRLNDPGPASYKLRDVVIVAGHAHYYHFLAHHLPSFLLLATAETDPAICATMAACPANLSGFLAQFMAQAAAPRQSSLQTLDYGVYDVENVIFAARPNRALTSVVGTEIVVPMILKQAGIADALREQGPVKLFVRRENHSLGRNLLNAAEIEAWFVARGFLSVNPGALSFQEQVILFSRATHVAGVEGGALINLMFAKHLRSVVMIAGPATKGENFFHRIVKDRDVAFRTFYGQAESAERSADYTFSRSELDSLGSEMTA